MPFARLKEYVHTLRFRLTLWMTLIVLVLVVLSMIAIGLTVRRSLISEFDALLRNNLHDIRVLLRDHEDRDHLYKNLDEIVQGSDLLTFAQLFDREGNVLWKSALTPELPPPFQSEGEEIQEHNGFRFVESDAPAAGLHVRVGITRAALDEDISLLNRIMVLSTVCILVFLPIGGLFLAGRATRPLQWIIATTARLEPERMKERLPIRGTDDELDQLSTTINGMLDRIASYIQRNRDFIGSAAHEIRSPLAAIRGSVEVALNRPRSNEEYAELLENVAEECARLSNLVDRLLLLAQGDAGQFATTSCTSLDKIVRESVDMFQGVAEVQDVPLILTRAEPAQVRGDEAYLRQVVRNLIDNALKFTSPPGRVLVSLRVLLPQCKVVLQVIDEGNGIAPEDLPYIFERFYRGDKSRQRQSARPGSGLGLSICMTIVRALNGEIRVHSEPGKGTTFAVELPLADSFKVGRSAKEPTP